MHPAIFLAPLFAAINPTIADQTQDDRDWWRDAVFYEVFVRSYNDSTSGPLADDGVGDFRGLIERLDYLNDNDPKTDIDLGVTALWLMPIMQSPSYHGYDVVDYRNVDDEYGTNEDFRELLVECHRRGIRVIVDLVLNHSSDMHPWFVDARSSQDSQYRDWFTWVDGDPGYRGPWGQQVWHNNAVKESGQYYYGCFQHGMPDLNVRNDDLTDELKSIAKFWIHDMGVDGFRLDAIRHLIENGEDQENTQDSIDWLEDYQEYCKSINEDFFSVGEVWSTTDQIKRYIPDAVDTAFEFELGMNILNAINSGSASNLRKAIDHTVGSFDGGRFATFLTNHDQPRVMTAFERDESKAKAAATLLLTLPGVPFIYYGEEIGISGDKPDPNIRTPMQWNDSRDADGFTNGKPWRGVQPDCRIANVEDQMGDGDSLFEYYRNLVSLRKSYQTLSTGKTTTLDTSSDVILAYTRDDKSGEFLVIINMSDRVVRNYSVSSELQVSSFQEMTDVGHRIGTFDDRGGWQGSILKPHESLVIKID